MYVERNGCGVPGLQRPASAVVPALRGDLLRGSRGRRQRVPKPRAVQLGLGPETDALQPTAGGREFGFQFS